jgi:hypothetical protein
MLAAKSIKKFKSGDTSWYVAREGATVSERRWVGMYQRGAKSKTYATPEIAHEHWKAQVAAYDAQLAKHKVERASRGPIVAPKVKRGKPLGATELTRLAKRWGDGKPWRPADVVAVERAFAKPLRLRLPAAFRAFAAQVGAAGAGELRVLSSRDMIRDTKKLVRVPRSARWETDDGHEVRIHTDHLVAFAADGPEARWCFCVDAPGEPTVYLHHQDQPRARIRDGKDDRGWISAAAAKPDFTDFASWLRAQKPDPG